MVFSIDANMTFGEVILYYDRYLDAAKAEGKKPVSFLRFVTGRY